MHEANWRARSAMTVMPLALLLGGSLAASACGPAESSPTPGSDRDGAARERADVQERTEVERALDLYVEGMMAGDADPIPLASDVIFVEPDGSAESTLRGIGEVAPFLERQPIDSIRVHETVIDGEYGCELTDYHWSEGPKMPIALCLRVVDGAIIEIRPYFDRSLFGR